MNITKRLTAAVIGASFLIALAIVSAPSAEVATRCPTKVQPVDFMAHRDR